MKKILFLFIVPFLSFGQVNFSFTTSESASVKNLFFKPVGQGGNNPVMIVDKNGNTLYSDNLGMKGWDWKVNLNNHITYYDRQAKSWHVVDSFFNTIDTVSAQNGYTADNHDFLALPNGNYVLFCYDNQAFPMDTIVPGGDPNAIVEGLVIQELNNEHDVIFEWQSWDHFNVTDNTDLDLTSDLIPFIHTNAIDIDYDEHFLISSRNLSEITKIHRTSGDIIWRWGGSQNQFIFLNDYPFTYQHCIKSLGDNKYLLFDNGNSSSDYTGNPNISRAVEYQLDLELMTATKTWEFVHPDSLFSPSISSVQRLENGNTLITFGNLTLLNRGAVIAEVNPSGEIVFELELDPPTENGNNNIYCANKFDWFFDDSIIGCSNVNACNFNINTINTEMNCIFPGDSCEVFILEQAVNGLLDDNCECVPNNTSIIEISNKKKLLYQLDLIGKDSQNNKFQFNIYDDGSVEKKYLIK